MFKITHSDIGRSKAVYCLLLLPLCVGFSCRSTFCGVVSGSISSLATILLMRGSRMFCQRESNSDVIFFCFLFSDYEGEKIQKPLKVGHHVCVCACVRARACVCAIYMASRWRADDGPTLNTGLVLQRFWTSIAKKKLYFYDFSGGDPDPLSPSLDPPMWLRGKRLDRSTLILLWLSIMYMLCSQCLCLFIVILTYFLCYRYMYLAYMFCSCQTKKDLSTRCGSVM